MSSFYHGDALELSIFGQSHSPAIGVTLSGLPAGLAIDMDELGAFLRRRAPGQNAWSTPRKEADLPEFLSGLVGNTTCGAPLCAVIRNTNTRSQDYNNLIDIPRPGHSDYTAQVKFGGYQDVAGELYLRGIVGVTRAGKVRRLSGRCRRRTLLRPSDRSLVHCGRHLQAAARSTWHRGHGAH